MHSGPQVLTAREWRMMEIHAGFSSIGSTCSRASLAGAFMLAIFVLMMALSAGRPLGLNVPAADDFVSWCMAAIGVPWPRPTFRSGEMIRVGLLIDKLPDRSRHWVELVCLVIGIGFIAFFAFYACQLVRDSWRFHEMSQGVISIPMWIPQLGYAFGLIILLIRLRRRIHPRAARQPAALREAQAADRRRGGRAGDPERGLTWTSSRSHWSSWCCSPFCWPAACGSRSR